MPADRGAGARSAPAAGPPVAAPDRADTPERVARALTALPRGWSDLPPAEVAPGPGAVAVWTGTHLFLWGGEDGHGRSARGRGWLFDPASRRWRAATAFAGRGRAATAWNGRELLAYDPG